LINFNTPSTPPFFNLSLPHGIKYQLSVGGWSWLPLELKRGLPFFAFPTKPNFSKKLNKKQKEQQERRE
jgi:hypothetical protein